jgi:hypothetical protein
MNGPIITQQLRGSAPLGYLMQVLETGGTPPDGLAEELSRGAVHAVVPADTPEQRALQFNAGGLLAAEPAVAIAGGLLQKVPTSVPTVAKIMCERMTVLHDPVLWVHEPLLAESELESFLGDEIRSSKVRLQRVNGQLYLAYERDIQAEEKLAKAIDASMLSWHFLAFVTEGIHQAPSVSFLVKQSQLILAGAYDGESVLIWERNGLSAR